MEKILYNNYSVVHIKSDKYAITYSNFLSKEVAVRLCSLLNGACKDETETFKVINELAIVGIIKFGVKYHYIFNKPFKEQFHAYTERIAYSTLDNFNHSQRFNFNCSHRLNFGNIDEVELIMLIQKYEERGGLVYYNNLHFEEDFLNPIIDKENKLLRREVVDFVISRGFRELNRDVWENDEFVVSLDRNLKIYRHVFTKSIVFEDKSIQLRNKVDAIFGDYLSVCNQLDNNTFLVSCINDKLKNSIINNFCGVSFKVEYKDKAV